MKTIATATRNNSNETSLFAKSLNAEKSNSEYKVGLKSNLNSGPGFDMSQISILPALGIQPKLTINQPNDKYEQEADRVADQVMRMPEAGVQRKCASCEKEEEENIQMKPLNSKITPMIQTKTTADLPSITTSFQNRLNASKGEGSQLQGDTNKFMSNSFGVDFSQVRVHNDSKAHRLNRDIQARAFTIGPDIYFNTGQYSPDTSDGKKLLAHELTHVVQQKNGVESHSRKGCFSSPFCPAPGRIAIGSVEPVGTFLQNEDLKKNDPDYNYRLQFNNENSFLGEIPVFSKTQNFNSLYISENEDTVFQTTKDNKGQVFSTQTPEGNAIGSGGGGGILSAPSSSHHCVPTIIRSSLPSGHIPATNSGGRFSAPFRMTADFDIPIPCSGVCGEYRQFVSGFSQVNGTDIVHPLCGNNMSRTTEHEDCLTHGGVNLRYGYHSIPFATSRFINPDQATGFSYRGFDAPGFNLAPFPSGTVLSWMLNFRGIFVDACDGDRPLQPASTWTAGGTFTVP